MGKTLHDDEFDGMSDEELANKLKQSIKDAEEWEEQNPDPQR